MHGHLDKIATSAEDFEYTRLASGELVSQMTRPNGVTSAWSYESNRDLITQVANGAISTYGYVNDAIGRRSSMSRSGSAHPIPDTISYSYNDRSEVTGALSDVDASYSYAYAYDPIGNRVSASEAGVPWTYTTNNLNQYTSATEDKVQLDFTYDLDGSMTYRPVDGTTGWTQVWNGENRMVETWKGNERLTFQYDYMGRRVEKKVYDGQTLATHLKFVYDGFKLVEELDGINADAPLRRYTWQPDDVGLDVVIQMSDVHNAVDFFYLHDANKNVMQMTDAVGIVTEIYSYAPFGKVDAAGGIMHFFGFSSEVSEPETGLNYYNYRYYCQNVGKWIRRDPKLEDGGLNIYGYLNNNINGTDELGQALSPIIPAAIITLIEAAVGKYLYNRAMELYPDISEDDNFSDKRRHCYVNCMYVRINLMSPTWAFIASLAKEVRDIIFNDYKLSPEVLLKDSFEDFRANIIGQSKAWRFGHSCYSLCKQYHCE